jgi:hypothetical protein
MHSGFLPSSQRVLVMSLTNSTESVKKRDEESALDQSERQDVLYDFLYKDSGRIASYYAQLFRGRLAQLEETDSERTAKDKTAKVSIHVASGDVKSISEIQSATKRIIDPHDVITTDVLSSLMSEGRINTNISTSPHGSLVIIQGTLVFVDKYMIELAAVAFEIASKSSKKPKTQEERLQMQGLQMIKAVFSRLDLPSAFLLRANDGVQVAGTIKESGMEEPISTYYFKHGTAGLSDVYMIGIKEVPSLSFKLPDTQLLGAGQQAAQALSDMLFPPEAIRVTPIALFRKL